MRTRVFHTQKSVTMKLPARIANYTDFYSSYHHAHNVGTMLRGPENALMPNWKWLPVAVSRAGQLELWLAEPMCGGQWPGQTARCVSADFRPDKEPRLRTRNGVPDWPGNSLGDPMPIDRAADHIFGLVLMNDWSARDIQAWEYQPLGPFLAKNFCTSISPWVVTLDALEPFGNRFPTQDPEPMPYLRAKNDFTFDIQLEASLQTPSMNTPHVITRTNFQNLYWSIAQQLAHHTVSGCNCSPAICWRAEQSADRPKNRAAACWN